MNRPNLFQVLPLALGILAAVAPAWGQADDSSSGAGAGAGQGRAPFAQRRHMGHGIGKEFENIKGVLTDDQKTQFEQIMTQSMSEGKPLRQQLIQLQSTSGDNPDAKTQSKIDDLKAQMRAHHKQTHDKVMALLTQQQKDQLKGMKQGAQKPAASAAKAPAAASTGSSESDDGSMGGPEGDK